MGHGGSRVVSSIAGILVSRRFHFFILAVLVLDLGLFQRRAHAVSMIEAAIWSTVWIALALLFAFGIWNYWHLWHNQPRDEGPQKAIEFLTAYLVEKALSVDNLFVFARTAVPAAAAFRLSGRTRRICVPLMTPYGFFRA